MLSSSIESLPFSNSDAAHTIRHRCRSLCKPSNLCVAVYAQERFILDVGVARIPASGPQAAILRAKYGARPDESRPMRRELFDTLSPSVAQQALFKTDELQQCSTLIQQFFPQATHQVHPCISGCVTGQGELKKARFDPLFSVNHTLAMLRANINRLIRRTWCTTKVPDRLLDRANTVKILL